MFETIKGTQSSLFEYLCDR